jgi:uncharacterized phiE125 gp8 family phage protein
MTYVPPTRFRYTQTTAPDQNTIVTLAEAKAHAIIDDTGVTALDTATNELVQSLINAAVQKWIEFTGVYPLHTKFKASLDASPVVCECWLRFPPIVTVDKVYGLDADATETVLDAADYAFDTINAIVKSFEWPSGDANFSNFNIDYTTGLGEDVDAVPDDVKLAIKMTVTHWFQHREAVTDISLREVPQSAQTIMQTYKPARF